MQASIFVADDESAVRKALVKRLSRCKHQVQAFQSGEELMAELEHKHPDLILLDLKMTGMSGIDVLKQLRTQSRDSLVIVLTAYGTVEDAVEAMKLDAYDFVIKTVDLQGVEPVVNRAVEYLLLRRRVAYETEHEASRYQWDRVVASSASMRALLTQLRDKAQAMKIPVCLTGEAGTGKEFLARVIHHNAPSAKGLFVTVNCAAVPNDHIEIELFGYEEGNSTDLGPRKRGAIEQAESGTLFLDEIGALDHLVQGKLRQAFQDGSFRRLGGTDPISLNCRVIVATNPDQSGSPAVQNGGTLFSMFADSTMLVPPLRNRIEDIVPLCKRLMAQFAVKFGKNVDAIDPEATALMEGYAFPGNVQELKSVIERAMILCRGKTLMSSDLPMEMQGPRCVVKSAS